MHIAQKMDLARQVQIPDKAACASLALRKSMNLFFPTS